MGNVKVSVEFSANTRPPSRPSFNLFDVSGLFFFGGNLRFDVHVAELARLKNLAAFEAFHELRVFVARDDLDTRMTTCLLHGLALGVDEWCDRRLDKVPIASPEAFGQMRIERYFRPG